MEKVAQQRKVCYATFGALKFLFVVQLNKLYKEEILIVKRPLEFLFY